MMRTIDTIYESFLSSPFATRAAVIQAETPHIETPLERIIAERSSTFNAFAIKKAVNHTKETTKIA